MVKFLQLTVGGVATGTIYALVALGFVVIYRATGVINFAQGGFVLLGAALSYNFTDTWGLPFYAGILLAMAAAALIGVVIERLVLHRMVGQPVYAVIMITIGLLIIIQQVVQSVWGAQDIFRTEPYGAKVVTVGDVTISHRDIATIVTALLLLGLFFLFFRYTKFGVAMRATAVDQEAAQAQGISAGRVFALSWAIAAAVAVPAGVMLTSGNRPLNLGVSFIALRAFPAIIIGGLESPGGAVIGGIVVGLAESYGAGYLPGNAPWLGNNFDIVLPYVIMLMVLLVAPYGLFGTREVRRV
ncbi:MAG: branched-chain amino acid ABC transporter permease [Acidimicrobiia bacterium]|nr:branched-chain amino acid ABC transporter permease [Acidimicrobiia bacterium]